MTNPRPVLLLRCSQRRFQCSAAVWTAVRLAGFCSPSSLPPASASAPLVCRRPTTGRRRLPAWRPSCGRCARQQAQRTEPAQPVRLAQQPQQARRALRVQPARRAQKAQPAQLVWGGEPAQLAQQAQQEAQHTSTRLAPSCKGRRSGEHGGASLLLDSQAPCQPAPRVRPCGAGAYRPSSLLSLLLPPRAGISCKQRRGASPVCVPRCSAHRCRVWFPERSDWVPGRVAQVLMPERVHWVECRSIGRRMQMQRMRLEHVRGGGGLGRTGASR